MSDSINPMAHPVTQQLDRKIRIGIVTVSDRASRSEYEDRGGPAIDAYLAEVLAPEWEAVRRLVPDDLEQLKRLLIDLVDEKHCCLVITTGGTGPSPRDVTPEATESVCNKMLPGFGELMRKVSLEKVPTAILSRQTAGIRGNALLVNLPGQPRAIGECLDAVFPAIPYCIELAGGPSLLTRDGRIKAYRPPSAKP
jgi:molybdopterin adenylyltransferase